MAIAGYRPWAAAGSGCGTGGYGRRAWKTSSIIVWSGSWM
jgi:hypothetical protein